MRAAHVFDEAKLAGFMKGRIDGYKGPLQVLQFEGGQSNPTFLLSDGGGRRYVLRKKPPGKLLPSAHQVDREYRVIKALGDHSDVPVPRAYALGIRPVSNLIDTPNWFSLIVALLAGVVGVVSLTEARSSTLIGVFISVTTIPAASDTGVSLAFGSTSEAWGSVLQLLLNVTVLTAVAVAGLPAQRATWRWAARRAGAAPSGLQETGG